MSETFFFLMLPALGFGGLRRHSVSDWPVARDDPSHAHGLECEQGRLNAFGLMSLVGNGFWGCSEEMVKSTRVADGMHGELRDAAYAHVRLILSLCLFTLQTSFIFQVPSIAFTDSQNLNDLGYLPALVASIAAAIFCVAGAFGFARRGLNLSNVAVWHIACVLELVGWVLCLVWLLILPDAEWIRIGSFLLQGGASVLWLPALTEGLAEAGPRKTIIYVLMAYLFTAFVGGGSVSLSLMGVLVLNVAISLAMNALFPSHRRMGKSFYHHDAFASAQVDKPSSVVKTVAPLGGEASARGGADGKGGVQHADDRSEDDEPADKLDTAFPLKLAVTYLFLGLASGVVGGSIGVFSIRISGLAEGLIVSLIVAVLIGAMVFVLKLDFNLLIYGIGFPLLALGFCFMLVFASDQTFASVIQESANMFLETLTWGVTSYLVLYAGISSTWISLCPTAGLFIGQSLGLITAHCATMASNDVWFTLLLVALLYLVMLVAMRLQNTDLGAREWGIVRPATAERETSPQTEVCDRMAIDYGLTAREGEILRMLAKGRTKRFIAERLFISEVTVKTHILRIYRKMDIHSQQELLDLVDAALQNGKNSKMMP